MDLRTFLFAPVLLAWIGMAHAQDARHEWVPYSNERFGFTFLYPADVFQLERSSRAGDGEVFSGMRGHGQLLVGAFQNSEGHTVESYQRYIAKRSYSDFEIHYAPRGQTWFVLSGEGNGRVFYEKVMFSCQGRVISSFALMYPTDSKPQFDPIVERVEDTFRAGRDCGRYARQ